jgi:ComF family protein
MLNTLIDFLFPRDAAVSALENMPAEKLLGTLPASEPFTVGAGNAKTSVEIDSLFAYSDERVKHLVWEIKYHRNERVATEVGRLLAEKIREVCFPDSKIAGTKAADETRAGNFLIVPVPLTRRRQNERGFHHTELLAKAVVEHLHSARAIFAPNVVEKIRHTSKQSSLEHRAERLTNVVRAFRVKDRYENNIIVIDDVVTTGATMSDMVRALREAGAKRIFCFAIAH